MSSPVLGAEPAFVRPNKDCKCPDRGHKASACNERHRRPTGRWSKTPEAIQRFYTRYGLAGVEFEVWDDAAKVVITSVVSPDEARRLTRYLNGG